jgi:hypothetical protein
MTDDRRPGDLEGTGAGDELTDDLSDDELAEGEFTEEELADDAADDPEAQAELGPDGEVTRPGRDTTGLPDPSDTAVAFWEGVGIEPVLLCLPRGTGYTLRHYRPTPEDDEVEEQPVFLGTNGRVYAFAAPESLIAFVRSDEPHDLSDVAEWAQVRTVEDLDVTPQKLNRYELDLVVQIARAGADGWADRERETLLLAGEVSRDIAAYAELPSVQESLSPGSPLDELDDDLRQTGFMARRRLRRYNPEQIAIGWRRVVRELEAVVDLRD